MDILQAVFSNTIVAFIILIGVVVFVHELGHFLAGKIFGLEIEEFSIGFGPKAFSIRKNNTDYRINWLPLGGYVRFYGSDLETNVPIEKKEKSILHAKLYKRAIVAFAGPLANFILSLCIMVGMAFYGIPENPAVVSVLPNSIAEQSGLKTGDKVIKINEKNIKNWKDFSNIVSNSPEKSLNFTIVRDDQEKSLVLTPQKQEIETPLGNKQTSGRIGVTATFTSSHLFIDKKNFLSEVGLKTGDKIVSINNIKIDFLFQFINAMETITKTHSQNELAKKIYARTTSITPVNIEYLTTNNVTKKIQINFDTPNFYNWAQKIVQQKLEKSLSWQDTLLSADQTIGNYDTLQHNDKREPAFHAWQKCGLLSGDTIVAIEGVGKITSPFQIYNWLDDAPKAFSANNKNAILHSKINVISEQGFLKPLSCEIPLRIGFDHLNREHVFLDFPLQFKSYMAVMPVHLSKANSIRDALQIGFNAVQQQILLTYNAIKMLFTGSIPLSNLGGPIAIASVAGDAAKGGLVVFLLTMAFISTNIGLMNLLPLPALDGGMLLLHGVEAAYGKPLPKSVQIAIQRIGVIFIIFLFIIVFYNDLLRLIRFY
ncbi:MAG: PDZ domain-containing protein [Spirobacillus cienkowskii]|jgi:regulator of sigma E protease|uniref:PDZ domain-containing protein n=1 Tax=Spirobacillus cienkowskii TaxID=495820 RepID=A0A369KRX0_9BACT|nr:MAG: PDZ domain-containing protein [Spirobacillus cienkowskii]